MTPELILTITCEQLMIDRALVIGNTRKREVCDARHIYVQLCKELLPDASDKQAGIPIGRHRSTVIHGRNAFSDLYRFDLGFKMKYEKVISSLTNPDPCHPTKKTTIKSESLKSTSQPSNVGLKCTDAEQIKSFGQKEQRNSMMPASDTPRH